MALVNQFCSAYYDTKLIFMSDEPEKELLEESIMKEEYSFTQNKQDDVDKIRYYWAYNMPCAVLVT